MVGDCCAPAFNSTVLGLGLSCRASESTLERAPTATGTRVGTNVTHWFAFWMSTGGARSSMCLCGSPVGRPQGRVSQLAPPPSTPGRALSPRCPLAFPNGRFASYSVHHFETMRSGAEKSLPQSRRLSLCDPRSDTALVSCAIPSHDTQGSTACRSMRWSM